MQQAQSSTSIHTGRTHPSIRFKKLSLQQACRHLRGLLYQTLALPWQEPTRSFGSFACRAVDANGAQPTSIEGLRTASNGTAAVAVKPGLGRILDTDLNDEVEKSYLSVSA